MRVPAIALILAVMAAGNVAAQEQTPPRPAPSSEPRLVFEREVFTYPRSARRDPFRPLTTEATGPLFPDLTLRGIIFSEDPAKSVAAVSDASNRQYRLRRGDSVGNATVIDIGPSRVVFAVLDFGIRRQEVLQMKAKREGASR
jgi:type II secretory pathway component PulC